MVPSLICGYAVSIPFLKFVYGKMIAQDAYQISPIPTSGATIQAADLGLLIPLASSIVPIQTAMNKQLNESINNTRSKTKGEKVEITDADSFETKLPLLVFGAIGVAAGVTIYFLMPYAVLNFDLGLLLEIFFLILVGLILGLTLIALNLQRLIETVLVYTMLCFERKSMKLLVMKNLSAHRESNRLTSTIYSLTLGSVIFIVVAASFQISLISSSSAQVGEINMSLK